MSSDKPEQLTRKSLDFYHSATQLRFDTWHRLEHYTSQLSGHAASKRDLARFRKAAHDAMTILETIEYYTAFPSREDFKLLWKVFEREDYPALARMVARLIRALTSHSYRQRNFSLLSRMAESDDSVAGSDDETSEEDSAPLYQTISTEYFFNTSISPTT